MKDKPAGKPRRTASSDSKSGATQKSEPRSYNKDSKSFGSETNSYKPKATNTGRAGGSYAKTPSTSTSKGKSAVKGNWSNDNSTTKTNLGFKKREERTERPTGRFSSNRSKSTDKPFGNRDAKPFGKDSSRDTKVGSERGKRSFDKSKSEERVKPYFNKDAKPWYPKETVSSSEIGRNRTDSAFEKKETRPRFKNDTIAKPENPTPFGPKDQKSRFADKNKPVSFEKKLDKTPEGKILKPRLSKYDNETDYFRKEQEVKKDDGINRQVGEKRRPLIDEDKMRKQLPPKVLHKLEKEEGRDTSIRLNRYIANAGLCSRREADDFIAAGQITVNGKEIKEMGYKVGPTDVIKYGKKILNREKLVYVLINKPKDFLTTTDDPEGRRTVMDLVKTAGNERIYPIGRLDRMTTGLLLMTNDGELADKLSHPSNNIRKIYQVELDKPITQEHFDSILEGITLEDGPIKADDLSIITPDSEVVGIEIHSGKNRIVRRIFESLGYEVMKLDRTTYAGLTKKELPRGNWRFLTEKEVIRLKYLI
jgi:23S rRNA pseudouridine2605 synthase